MSKLRLRYLTGSRSGLELAFTGPRVRIGRSRDNDLMLQDAELPRASKHHAEALVEDGRWWIVDLGSIHHTFLNSSPVTRSPLRTGDVLKVGDDELSVRIDDRRLAWIALVGLLVSVATIVAIVSAYALRPSASSFETIAATAPRSVYLLAVDDEKGRAIVGTAFSIDAGRRLLATNAHVANELRRRSSPADSRGHDAGRPIAVRSDQFDAVPVGRIWIHPGWRPGSLEQDVALLQIDPVEHVAPLRLADRESVARLRRGVAVASFGFPAASTDALKPRGRLAVDVVGDVRLPYIETGLSIAPGTSGSPVFDQTGAVVGLVVGGDFVRGLDGQGATRPSGTGVNWVIAVTSLDGLLDQVRR